MNKKSVVKILVWFMVLAVILTYISFQVYNASIPVVTTAESFSASLQVSKDTEGKIVYQDVISYVAPVEILVEEVYVKAGESVINGQELMKVSVESLETKKEELENKIIETQNAAKTDKAKSEAVPLLQIDIAQMELSLFKSNRELAKLIEEKNHEADILSYQEKIEETNLQMKLALEALYNYEAPIRYDGEERSLMRAVERIKVQLKDPSITDEKRQQLNEQLASAELDLQVYSRIPSILSNGYDISQELNLKLAVLQAKNNLLETDEYYITEKNAAQLQYEAKLYEYQQSQNKNAQEAQIAERKLELSIAQYQEQLDDMRKTNDIKPSTQMQIKETKNLLTQVEALIKSDGILSCLGDGEVTEINAQENQRAMEQVNLLKLCGISKGASIVWKMDTDDFSVGDKITADLTVNETVQENGEDVIVEKERKVKLNIIARRFIADENVFEYTADIPQPAPLSEPSDDDIKLAMSNSQSVKISMNKAKAEYETVVPISAISFIDEHKGTVFCAVSDKQGRLVARKIEVEILDYDNKNAALEKNIKDKVVVFSDRPLSSEGVIKEDEN